MDFTKEINVEIENFVVIPGRDGFSPILESEEVEGGHIVTMTDKEGEKNFFVRDGKDYEHSEEFTRLANQVHRDAETSTAKVLEVIEYGNRAKDSVDNAKTEAVNDVNTARNDAESSIQAKRTSAENAIDADRSAAISQITSTKTSAVNSVTEAKTSGVNAVNDAKDSALGALNSAKETAVSEVDTAKGSALSAISSEKTSAVNAVNAKQTEAVNAVNAAAEAFFDEYPLEKVEAIESNVTSLIERVDNIDDVIIETVEPLQKQADRTERSLDALWKLNRGQTYDFEEQTESGTNVAPSGAMFMDTEEVYGKSEQFTTNGYQLVPFADIYEGNIRNAPFNVDIPSGSYILSFLIESPQPAGYAFDFYDENNSRIINQYISSSPTITKRIYNLTFDVSVKKIVFYGGQDGVSTIKGIMFEKGTVAHDYEPYTGGIPSPNPDYPQEIKSVERVDVTVVGKNICDSEIGDINLDTGIDATNSTTLRSKLHSVQNWRCILY